MKRFVTLTAAALAFAATPALAHGNHSPTTIVAGGVTGSFEAGQNAGFEVKGIANGSSASGSQVEFKLNNPSVAAFGSLGLAGSSVEVTPFSVDTNSHHAGAFAGFTAGGAKLEGQAMNFGQSDGTGKFEASASQWQNAQVDFAAFGAFVD